MEYAVLKAEDGKFLFRALFARRTLRPTRTLRLTRTLQLNGAIHICFLNTCL